MMKRFILMCLFVLVFVLSSCDSWKLSEEEIEEYKKTFLDYLDGDEYGEMYYFRIIDESQNYTIRDGVMITDDSYIENKFRTDIWQTSTGYFVMDTSNDLELYYKDGTLYTYDVTNNSKTFTSYNASDFTYKTDYNSFLDKLFLILEDSNYEKYVKSVDGIRDPTEHRLTFTFDEFKLKEDHMLEIDETVELQVTIDLEDSIYGFEFRIKNHIDTTAIGFERSREMSYINNRFPDDLDSYEEETQ